MRSGIRCVSLLCCLAASACSQNSSSRPFLPAGLAKSVFSSLYPFGKNAYDGSQPAFLVPFRGVLYGTASGGGPSGDGIVYSVTPQGKETILHTFALSDGAVPIGPLFNVRGVFLGTTSTGGPGSAGEVFSIDTDGSFKVVHAFKGGSRDGAAPDGGLVGLSGKLYGTTSAGGANSLGTVYSLTLGGVEHVIHSFTGSDGEQPISTLIVAGGELYGTTLTGGKFGGGTIFSVTTTGKLKTVHSFGKGKDGLGPYYGALIDVDGTLYGTTLKGGAKGVGTIFKSSLSGTEKVLHSFGGTATKGCEPYAGLVEFNGGLYGTTVGGAGPPPCIGSGTVFRVSESGATTLHKFTGGNGGNAPVGLVPMNGTLYGVTLGGGPYNQGMFFSLTP